jgi:hypothetical protein
VLVSLSKRQSYREPLFLLFIVLAAAWLLFLARTILLTKSDIVRRFAWGVSGGSITGFQNFLKDALAIVKATSSNSSPDRPWMLLSGLIVMAILTAFGGLLLLTACMKRYDATYSAAMFVGSFVIMASIMSAVHYNTLQHLDGFVNRIFYPVGLAILMSGVYMLIGTTSSAMHNDAQIHSSDHDRSNAMQQHSGDALLAVVRLECHRCGNPRLFFFCASQLRLLVLAT